MSNDQDLALIDATLAGDRTAFETIVLKYQRLIMTVVIRMTNNMNDAADITQQVFLKAFSKLNSFKRKATFKTWLYSITLNMVRNELRNKKRWGKPEQIDEMNFGEKSKIEEKLINKDRKQRLKAALEQLPLKQREVVMLRTNEEFGFAAIAEILGISENSAKVNFHHAVKRLKHILTEKRV